MGAERAKMLLLSYVFIAELPRQHNAKSKKRTFEFATLLLYIVARAECLQVESQQFQTCTEQILAKGTGSTLSRGLCVRQDLKQLIIREDERGWKHLKVRKLWHADSSRFSQF